MLKFHNIDHVAITVEDLEYSTEWYLSTFEGKRILQSWDGPPIFIKIGDCSIELFPAEKDIENKKTTHALAAANVPLVVFFIIHPLLIILFLFLYFFHKAEVGFLAKGFRQ